MASIKIDQGEKAYMLDFYREELHKTLQRLDHIQTVLEELGDKETRIDLKVSQRTVAGSGTGRSTSAGKTAGRPAAKRTRKASTTRKSATAQKKPAKRGRKSKWEERIVAVLTEEDTPLTYEQLTDAILKKYKLPAKRRKQTKDAVTNTIFRMRKNKGTAQTLSAGQREKFVALTSWYTDEGTIQKDYLQRIKK